MLALTLLVGFPAVFPVGPPRDDLLERLDAYFAPLVESGLFAGSVLVVRGEDRLARAWGEANLATGTPNTIDTRYKLMSTSKPFTALAVMTLVEEGRLELDDLVSEHLSDWPEAWGAITVRDLMTHTTGLPNLEALLFRLDREAGRQVSWSVLSDALTQVEAGGERGARFAYSNFHYVVLGCLLEELTGEAYPDVITARVLEPAGMDATGFDDGGRPDGLAIGYAWGPDGDPDLTLQDMSGIQAAGGLWSSARDLGRLHDALGDRAIVGEEAWAEMTRPVVMPMSSGWFRNPMAGRECIGHSGGSNGYVADFLHFPDDDACVVVQSNYSFAPINRISNDVARLTFGEDVDWPRPTLDELRAYAGVYVRAEGEERLLVRLVGGALSICRVEGEGRLFSAPVSPLGDRSFVSRSGVLRFDGEGELRLGAASYAKVAVEDGAWAHAVGGYRQDYRKAFLGRDEGRFLLRVEYDVRPDHVLVPLDSREALVLSHAGLASRVELDGGVLAWTRYGRRSEFQPDATVERPEARASCSWCLAEVLESSALFTCDDGCSYCGRCESMNASECPNGGGKLRPLQ